MSRGSTRQLSRSRDDRVLAGVAGGIAEYFEISPTLVRVVWVIGAVVMPPMTAPVAVVLYFILALVMPSPANE